MGYVTASPCYRRRRAAEQQARNFRKGKALFKRFHCFDGSEVIVEPHGRVIPPVLVHLGYLKGLIYSSDRGERGSPKTYIHFMESLPRLATDVDGTQLYIIGGDYRITPRGIEG